MVEAACSAEAVGPQTVHHLLEVGHYGAGKMMVVLVV